MFLQVSAPVGITGFLFPTWKNVTVYNCCAPPKEGQAKGWGKELNESTGMRKSNDLLN